jgi:hypothetical protein
VDGKPELTPGEPLAAGEDAADLIARGWQAAHLALLIDVRRTAVTSPRRQRQHRTSFAWVTPRAIRRRAIEAAIVENATPLRVKDHSPRRGFRLDDRGIWFVDVKDGVQAAPRWISSPCRYSRFCA